MILLLNLKLIALSFLNLRAGALIFRQITDEPKSDHFPALFITAAGLLSVAESMSNKHN